MNLVLGVCFLCVCLKISKKLRSRIHLLPFSDFEDVYFDSSFPRKLGIKLRSNCCCYGNSKKIQFHNFLMEILFGLEMLLSSHTIFLNEIVSNFYL